MQDFHPQDPVGNDAVGTHGHTPSDLVQRLRTHRASTIAGQKMQDAVAAEIEKWWSAELDIRADERAKIAALITEHEATLTGFTGDTSNVLKLLAYLLTLRDDS